MAGHHRASFHRGRGEGRRCRLRRQRLERRHSAVGIRAPLRHQRVESFAARHSLHRSRRLQARRRDPLQGHRAQRHAVGHAASAGRDEDRSRAPRFARQRDRQADDRAQRVERGGVDTRAAGRRAAGDVHGRSEGARTAPRYPRRILSGGVSASGLSRRYDADRAGIARRHAARRQGQRTLSPWRTDGRPDRDLDLLEERAGRRARGDPRSLSGRALLVPGMGHVVEAARSRRHQDG